MSEGGGMSVNCLTAGGQTVATDVKGNITTLPANLRPTGATTAMNLTWDSDNKLRSADIDANGTADVNFQYDALGRRVARTGTGGSVVFVQMDQQTIADYPVGGAASTPTYRYVYASYIDEPVVRKTAGAGGTLVYFHRNQQYSVTAITTSTGAVAERYAYTAYGQPTILDASASVLSSSAINNRYTYTGREWDATLGLHHFRARWMSPSAGRFLGRDPIGYVGSEWGLNDFGDSNPFNSLDPTGLIIVNTGPHGGGLYGGCETLTTVKTEVVCKYFKLGWWSLWEKEIRFPYIPGIDATKLCRSNTPSKWVFERVGYERTTTTTTWCRSCSPVAVGLCKPSFKVGPVECVITATVVVGKIYLDNQPEVDEKKEPWDPPSEPDIDNGGDCYCMCKVNGSSNEPMGRMSRAECKKLPFAKSGVESCYCKGDK